MGNGTEDKYVCGRRAILQALDKVLSEENSIKLFAEAFRKQFEESPLPTFRILVMPLLPKEMLLTGEETTYVHRIELIPAKSREEREKENRKKSSEGREGSEGPGATS